MPRQWLGRKGQDETVPVSHMGSAHRQRARGWDHRLPQMLRLRRCVSLDKRVSKCDGAGGGLVLLLTLFRFAKVPQSVLEPLCFPSPVSALSPSLKSYARAPRLREYASVASKVGEIQKERLKQNGLIKQSPRI